ncbi:MAG: hypothetical protein K0Q57_900 [Gammaproteobacteria bacterium]|jgi:opacity protein-like surface antigen|nr:hypothetical protein [Gammaproteobacteria bacterium]
MKSLKTLSLIAMFAAPFASYASPQFYAGIGTGAQYGNLYTNIDRTSLVTGYHYYNSFTNNNVSEFANLMFGVGNLVNNNYWGIEADAYYNGAHNNSGYYSESDTTNYNLYTKMPWRFELDGILGRYVTPKTLAYGKIGVTTGKLQSNFYAYDPSGDVHANMDANKQLYGGVIGLGAKYSLNPSWNIGVEADYIDFLNSSLVVTDYYRVFNTASNFQYKANTYLLKAYVSYVF